MTTVYIVRHGSADSVGKWLAGRSPGVHLNQRGRAEAQATAEYFARAHLSAIYASPLERTQETAATIARATGAPVITLESLTEIGYGEWTGRSFASMMLNPEWLLFNVARSKVAPPGGEHAIDAQRRAVDAMREIVKNHPNEAVVVVTHADVIRLILCALLDTPIDDLQAFQIETCSITTVVSGGGDGGGDGDGDGTPRVIKIGDTTHLRI